MKNNKRLSPMATFAAVALSAAMLLQAGGAATAQDYAYMTCNQLWYARNAIYAQKGYCFKTARARAVFGPACFPPYGQLSGWEQQQVSEIQYWERRRGC